MNHGWGTAASFGDRQVGKSFIATGPTGTETAAANKAAAVAGMAEMSRKYEEMGRELYLGVGDRERD
ncbi:hypothetical protein ACNI3Q_08935 [Sphingomonas sp. FW199]|uniref:hypothetical protein n=1 Tax=Sphingomonas sp. FW199 TaxID=3400217 RepID=UPI003CF998B2